MNYELKLISEHSVGVIKHQYYQITNYDNNVENLKEFIKKNNEDSLFNISWYIDDEEKGIVEKVVDTFE